jgi:ParB family chromosome partitioning protein
VLGRQGAEIGTAETTKYSVIEISQNVIEVNPHQPRRIFKEEELHALAASIKVDGIIQPITLREALNENGKYQLISGERRWRASQMAGLAEMPAYIRQATDQEMLEMALIENIQRENLNAIEVAFSYRRLMDECKLNHEEMADRVGKDRATVSNYLRLLRLPETIQTAVREGKLGMGHARAILGVVEIDQQLYIFNQIIKRDLSARATEDLARSLKRGTKKIQPETQKPQPKTPVLHYREIQNRLTSRFEAPIKIAISEGEKGEIVIPFSTTSDLNRLLDMLEQDA